MHIYISLDPDEDLSQMGYLEHRLELAAHKIAEEWLADAKQVDPNAEAHVRLEFDESPIATRLKLVVGATEYLGHEPVRSLYLFASSLVYQHVVMGVLDALKITQYHNLISIAPVADHLIEHWYLVAHSTRAGFEEQRKRLVHLPTLTCEFVPSIEWDTFVDKMMVYAQLFRPSFIDDIDGRVQLKLVRPESMSTTGPAGAKLMLMGSTAVNPLYPDGALIMYRLPLKGKTCAEFIASYPAKFKYLELAKKPEFAAIDRVVLSAEDAYRFQSSSQVIWSR